MRYSPLRLHSADYAIFARSRGFRSEYLKASVVFKSGRRYGVVAGKKVSALAVIRNRVKRRLRHLIINSFELLPQNAWIVFIAFPEAALVSFSELEKDFGELIGRIHAPKSGNSSYKAV